MAGVVAGVAQAAWRAAREFVGLGDESESQPAPLPGPERREEGGAQPTRRATALSAVGICVGALVVAATMLGNRRRRRQPGAQADRCGHPACWPVRRPAQPQRRPPLV
jgi:hypothetical protein